MRTTFDWESCGFFICLGAYNLWLRIVCFPFSFEELTYFDWDSYVSSILTRVLLLLGSSAILFMCLIVLLKLALAILRISLVRCKFAASFIRCKFHSYVANVENSENLTCTGQICRILNILFVRCKFAALALTGFAKIGMESRIWGRRE